MQHPIDFYFDFASPYGFIAAMRIDDVAKHIGRAVNWRVDLLATRPLRWTPQ